MRVCRALEVNSEEVVSVGMAAWPVGGTSERCQLFRLPAVNRTGMSTEPSSTLVLSIVVSCLAVLCVPNVNPDSLLAFLMTSFLDLLAPSELAKVEGRRTPFLLLLLLLLLMLPAGLNADPKLILCALRGGELEVNADDLLAPRDSPLKSGVLDELLSEVCESLRDFGVGGDDDADMVVLLLCRYRSICMSTGGSVSSRGRRG